MVGESERSEESGRGDWREWEEWEGTDWAKSKIDVDMSFSLLNRQLQCQTTGFTLSLFHWLQCCNVCFNGFNVCFNVCNQDPNQESIGSLLIHFVNMFQLPLSTIDEKWQANNEW